MPNASVPGIPLATGRAVPVAIHGTRLVSWRHEHEPPKGHESEPAVGWSRAAQDAAESLTVAIHENVATQPFLKRRIGYGTTGAFLITVFVLLTIATALLVIGPFMGPIAPCSCF